MRLSSFLILVFVLLFAGETLHAKTDSYAHREMATRSFSGDAAIIFQNNTNALLEPENPHVPAVIHRARSIHSSPAPRDRHLDFSFITTRGQGGILPASMAEKRLCLQPSGFIPDIHLLLYPKHSFW